jgi:hypothetical protein
LINFREIRETKKTIKKISFRDLMILLVGPDPDKVMGCALQFPDSAFFLDGKVTEIMRTDKEGYL